MSEQTFHQEYMNEFWDDDKQIVLKRLANQYHEKTEAFDQVACTHRTERGIAMPTTRWERCAISDNACNIKERLGAKAQALGFSPKEWSHAIQSAAHRHDR